MGHFDKIGSITPTDRSPFFVQGEYVLKVLKNQIGNSQQGKGAYWVTEVEILASSTPDRAVSSKMSWPMYFSTGEVVLANIKGFLAAVLGHPHTAITPAICEEVTNGDGTLLTGRIVRASAALVKTRKGTDFTAINWGNIPEAEQAAEITKVNALGAVNLASAATQLPAAAPAPPAAAAPNGAVAPAAPVGSELAALLGGTS